MAPILIDSRDLLKLGLASALVTALVFAAGFFMGHQRAADFYQAGSEVRSLSLPEKTVLAENILETQVPEVIDAGEHIDVDRPETSAQVEAVSQDLMPDSAGGKPIEKSPDTPLVSSVKGKAQTNEKPVGTLDSSVVELSKIKYSIQVGMYGRLANAENMVKMLQAKQYDAYVSDYTNSKNEIRYNVRFGYFANKKSAIAGLEKFMAEQKSDGYLVNFSAERIVNLAGASKLDAAGDVSSAKNKEDKSSAPASVPLEATEDTIPRTDLSRADMLSNSLISTN